MKERFTLEELLTLVELHLSNWFNIILVNDNIRPTRLIFERPSEQPGFNSGSVRVTCERPDGHKLSMVVELQVFSVNGEYHISKSWRRYLEYLVEDLDDPSWNVHPLTLWNIREMRNKITKVEKIFEPYEGEDYAEDIARY